MNELNVVILDYGSGNVASVYSMVKRITQNVKVSNEQADIEQATHFILPGVGSFSEAARKVNEVLPFSVLEDRVLNQGVPFLGICVGMQLLFTSSEEFGLSKGFNWIEGEVVKISQTGLPIPHIGWNNIINKQENSFIEDDMDMYFVHSYRAQPKDESNVFSIVEYGEEICAFVGKGNIFGTQFHPEKSQMGGKKLISKFLEY
ncbi:MAG: imidazole glycerol phosphate synthase subunit HisH [Gammaproteobacteria bacterium]|nr:imidazole glycerol phosphate synthase subunit HisH [Gammaproteobacteria bacterium]